MKSHILLIDPLEKLKIKKDTSLLLAATLKELGRDVYLAFTHDLHFTNLGETKIKAYDFTATFSHEPGYLKDLILKKSSELSLSSHICLHFRVDPPFDTAYLRLLLILRGLKEKTGVQVINDPEVLCSHNEKMIAYEYKDSLPSYVGSSEDSFQAFCEKMASLGHKELVLKPLDLYQGIGVERCSLEKAKSIFQRKTKDFSGAIVAQPFMKEVEKGEKRAIYFAGQFIGAILKVPKARDFITNIAAGASFEKCELTNKEKNACEEIVQSLDPKKVPWVAFDLLGEIVQEANITCPGLLNEVSYAHGKSLAEDVVALLN